ncbi:hypothetical protein [uncultured Nocardioides sp.]|uniref:hypothetical protein n=1 Tax=uncultured Nocardioides sp. TaxID=198441 RepID=UPI00262F8FD6|nr:hypothetical protein [uncultured Nocardioides sp.]
MPGVPRHVVLHVGAMKTGTSFLQSVLDHHRAPLAAAGTTFPPSSVHAVRAVLRGPAQGPPDATRWRELAGSTDGDLLVSMEFLSFAGPERIALLLEPFAGDRVSVVVGVRDQRAVLGAQWQTHCRNRGVLAWPDWLRAIRGDADPDAAGVADARRTWDRAQRVPRLLDRWTDAGVDRVVAVTVPPSGTDPGVLWDRFARAARLPEVPVDVTLARTNPSLGHGSCELLRRVNPLLADRPAGRYRRAVRDLANTALVARRDAESRVVADEVAVRRALEANARVRERLGDGVELVGSPDDLPTPEEVGTPPAGRAASVCEEAEVAAAGRTAYAHLHGRPAPDGADVAWLVAEVAEGLR